MLKKFKKNAEGWMLNQKKKLEEKNESLKKLTICKKCYTFYYKKSWHLEMPTELKEHSEEEVSVTFSQCPPCIEEEEAIYEKETNLIFG